MTQAWRSVGHGEGGRGCRKRSKLVLKNEASGVDGDRMSMKENLQKAIAAHGLWKQRLRSAMGTGKSEFAPATVRLDNQCEFGKWLFSLDPASRQSPHYNKVKSIHADFHKEAARILDLALNGKRSEAEEGLSRMGKFEKLSAGLTLEIMGWSSGSKA
jgi:hypothetical protein